MQDEYNFFLEIADVQALTDNFNNPEKVRRNVYEITMDLLSIGIDPSKVNFFIQSKIPEIAELTVFYSNLVTVARLERNPTVKTEIAQFNSIYGETLTEPEQVLSTTTRVKGLDGNEKMGKSLGNAIYLIDNEETIKKKVMGAVTDKNKIKKDDPANPDVCMVYYYHKLVNSKENTEKVCSECKKGARGCVACKKELIEAMTKFLKPIQEKRKYYEENPEEVKKILQEGTTKAQNEAKENMKNIKKHMMIDYDLN